MNRPDITAKGWKIFAVLNRRTREIIRIDTCDEPLVTHRVEKGLTKKLLCVVEEVETERTVRELTLRTLNLNTDFLPIVYATREEQESQRRYVRSVVQNAPRWNALLEK